MAFIFTDLLHGDSGSDFLYYGMDNSNQMATIVNQADILMNFLIFTPENELHYSRRLEWEADRFPLQKKTNHKVGLTFISNIDRNEFNTTGKLNSTMCDQIQTLQSKCKQDPQTMKDCPNIVNLYGFCVHELQVLLCMEVMDLSLKELFMKVHQKGLTFSEDMIGYITVSIIDAMAFCKSKGIIHRDIKPPNILINYT
uniref:mitogen-activated protein kinase kinase n=1 Tax=Acrobeloides nanus TaxID=290746 RepID=A0A914D6H5_9BILA